MDEEKKMTVEEFQDWLGKFASNTLVIFESDGRRMEITEIADQPKSDRIVVRLA